MPAIKNNILKIKSKISEKQKYCFVAKANCYGYGVKLCKFIEADVDCFAVSSASEFFELKKLVKKPIIILDPVFQNIKDLIKHEAILTIANFVSLKKIIQASRKSNQKISVFIKVNTGMNRFGFKTENEILKVCKILKKTQNISVLGVFSHYFDAKNQKNAKMQTDKFLKFEKIFKKFFDEELLFSISATDAVFAETLEEFDMVRIGLGGYSDRIFETINLSSSVLEVNVLQAGEGAGYGAAFVAKTKSQIAVVGIGYGDGIFRNIVKYGKVLIHGKFYKIVAICMDALLIDVTGASVRVGDRATIIGRSGENQIFICDIASWCDTIEYEVIVRLSKRIKRRYVLGERCKLSQENIEQEN